MLAPDAECSKFFNSLFFGVLEAYSWNKMNYNQAMKNCMGLGVFSCFPFLFEVTRGFWKMWWIILHYKSWVTFSCFIHQVDYNICTLNVGMMVKRIADSFSVEFFIIFWIKYLRGFPKETDYFWQWQSHRRSNKIYFKEVNVSDRLHSWAMTRDVLLPFIIHGKAKNASAITK